MKNLVKKVVSIAAILSVVLVGAPLSGVQASSYFSPSISVDESVAKRGDVLNYTLKIKGTGYSHSVWTHLSFAGPIEYIPGSATATKGSNVASLGDSFIQDNKHRNLGVLKDGQTLTVSFKAKVKSDATNDAKTEVKANIQSRDENNNVVKSQDCTAKATIAVESKEVKKFTAIKTVDKKVAKRGEVLTYTLQAKNIGNVTLHNFFIMDQLPEGVTLVPGSTRLTRNTVVTVTDAWITDGLNTGNFAPGKTFTVVFKAKVNGDVANDTVLENVGNFRSDELPDWVRCPVYTKVIVKTEPTPTPTPTPEQTPTPTPTPSPTGEVKGATPTPAPVTELPSTGPGAAVLASLGGIVSALMGRKYFISR